MGCLFAPPDVPSLIETISQINSTFEDVTIVADGLDECGSNAREVSRSLHGIHPVTNSGRDVRIALLSRSEQVIRDQLERDFVHVRISARSEDLSLYVASEMEKRIKDGRLEVNSADLKAGIVKALVEGADGM